MLTLNLNSPTILQRKVLLEKSDNTDDFISDKKNRAMKLKRNLSVLICLIVSFLSIYSSMFFISLNGHISAWLIGERISLLIFTTVSVFLLFYYCNHQMINKTYENGAEYTEEITIELLSLNWVKKLFSVFFILICMSLFTFLIFAFCTMNLSIATMSVDNRIGMLMVIGALTVLCCVLVFHNVVKLFKIEL